MPRVPDPDSVRLDLEEVLTEISGRDRSLPVYLPDGRVLQYDRRYLLTDDGSLGPVARLILMRCRLRVSAKDLQSQYRAACDNGDLRTSNYTSLQYAFSLSTSQLKSLPDKRTLSLGMSAVLDRWRAKHGNNGVGLPSHPEPALLFEKRFAGRNACKDFLDYLEYTQPPVSQLASGRRLKYSQGRVDFLKNTANQVVYEDAMLYNIHADNQWDGLRAFSETLARELEKKETDRARLLSQNLIHKHRDVLFVPLRANAIPYLPSEDYTSSHVVPDEHMGLDRLMGILLEFTSKGSAADIVNAAPMTDDTGFARTLQTIREQLMRKPRIIVFDGVYNSDLPNSRKTIERVIADEHFLFVLKRLMEPLLTSTTNALPLTAFYQNRFVITSNSESIADTIWHKTSDSNRRITRTPPVTQPLTRAEPSNYYKVLKSSLPHARQVESLLRKPGFEHCRNDVVNQLLNTTVSLLASHFASRRSQNEPEAADLTRAVEYYAKFLRRPDNGLADQTTVINALFASLISLSKEFNEKDDDSEPINVARLWLELLLLLSIAPEGLTLETIDRSLIRLSMTLADISHPLPTLLRAREKDCLDQQIVRFMQLASSIMGFIRREFVEGPEVEDHPLESWEGLIQVTDERKDERFQGKTIDFRYPEIRRCLQLCDYWQTLSIDRCLLHRIISEIALQYQANFFRHTAYRHRGAVRYWRRLLTALYHGLASIGDPDLDLHKDYGVRGAYADGSSKDYWLFLYAKLYRQIMERPSLWRISRIIGLNDLQSSLLELFSKPWQLLDYQDNGGKRQPRFIEHFRDSAQPQAEYYLARMRDALARGEVDAVSSEWPERFNRINPQPDTDNRLMMQYSLLDLKVQTVENISTEYVIDVLRELTGMHDQFSELELLSYDPQTEQGLATGLPSVGQGQFDQLPGLMTLVQQDKVTELIRQMIDKMQCKTSTVTIALNYYGTLSRLESDRADFAEGYQPSKRLPKGLPQSMRENLKTSLNLTGPQCSLLRRRALARLLLIEAARIALFRNDPTGVGFTRSKGQGRTAIRLALKLDDQFREQLAGKHSTPSAYFRFARRMSDSCTRMSWEYPRDQAYALVMEAAMLRSESDRIIQRSSIANKPNAEDAELALRLLKAARSTIGRAERVLTTPNLASQAMLRMALERHKLNRDLSILHSRFQDEKQADIYQQHAKHDFNMLRGFADNDARPYWNLLVYLQRDAPQV
ncbi:MAG: hypothetical protein AB8B63_25155 [Granulosicoccus sp.]